MDNPVSLEYNTLLNTIQAPVFVVDASKHIIDINNHTKRLFHSLDIIGNPAKISSRIAKNHVAVLWMLLITKFQLIASDVSR